MGDFWHMGGYGFYVWGSYGVTAACLVVETLLLTQQRRTLLQRLGRMLRMSAAEVEK